MIQQSTLSSESRRRTETECTTVLRTRNPVGDKQIQTNSSGTKACVIVRAPKVNETDEEHMGCMLSRVHTNTTTVVDG